jgi:hypothetical protein
MLTLRDHTMLTLTLLLVLGALVATLAHALGNRAPLWVAVLLLVLTHLVSLLPIR